MSGFSPDWLALREPADHASINAAVRAACVRVFAGRDIVRIVDLGCGTGSNLRSLAPALGVRQHWMLIDNDPALLEIAGTSAALSGVEVACKRVDLASVEFRPLLSGADLVTASALFDLFSVEAIERLAAAIAAERCAFYTVLTYDGIAAFLPEHPADGDMREAFNQHQRTDKGFGPAAGPNASDALAAAFARYGYSVVRGKSPWVLDAHHRTLRRELERGWAAAVRETGLVHPATIDDWLAHRNAASSAVTIIGHEDLLALPPTA
jgi:SAM-dependent methyltransferase